MGTQRSAFWLNLGGRVGGQLWGKSSLASSQQTKIHQEWEKAEGYIFTVNSSVMIRVGKIIFVKGQMQLEREKKKKKAKTHKQGPSQEFGIYGEIAGRP